MRPLRIAQIAPLSPSTSEFDSEFQDQPHVPRDLIQDLTTELETLGHRVTLFGSHAGSIGRAGPVDPFANILQLESVFARSAEFDVLHFHIPPVHFPILRRAAIPSLTSLYGSVESESLKKYLQEFIEIPLVATDERQRSISANWKSYVPLSIPKNLYQASSRAEGYLAFTSTITHLSQVQSAIEVARQSGQALKIFSKIPESEEIYFERNLAHLMQLPFVEFIKDRGTGDTAFRNKFLSGAVALLLSNPVGDPTSSGVTFSEIEALASGTPVLKFDGVEDALSKLAQVSKLDRKRCRAEFESQYTTELIAKKYVDLYRREIESSSRLEKPNELRPIRSPAEKQIWS